MHYIFTFLFYVTVYKEKKKIRSLLFTHINTHWGPFSTWTEKGATCWWGDILKSIFLYVKRTPPSRLSLSQHRALGLTAHSPGWGGRLGRKFYVTESSSSPAAGEMARWHVGESGGDGGRGFTLQWKWQCQLNITFNFLVLWSPGY